MAHRGVVWSVIDGKYKVGLVDLGESVMVSQVFAIEKKNVAMKYLGGRITVKTLSDEISESVSFEINYL